MTSTLAHPELEALEQQILGYLADPEQQLLEEHLLICENCRAMSGALEREINQIRRALRAAESALHN